MKWINCSDRLPEVGKRVFTKWNGVPHGTGGVFTDWLDESKNNVFTIGAYHYQTVSKNLSEFEWLDETNSDVQFNLDDVKQYAFWLLQWANKPENKNRTIHKSECDDFLDLNIY